MEISTDLKEQQWDQATGESFSLITEQEATSHFASFSRKSLEEEFIKMYEKVDACNEKQAYSIAEICYAASASSLDEFDALENKRYRWVFQTDMPLPRGRIREAQEEYSKVIKDLAVTNSAISLDETMKYVLQINLSPALHKTKKASEWIDWVYLSRSISDEEKLGLFAARRFNPGIVIGCIVGKRIWTAKGVGSDALPEGSYASDQFNIYNRRSLKQTVVSPASDDTDDDVYLGFHFIKDSNGRVERKRRRGGTKSKNDTHDNVEILPNGDVRIIKAIQKDDEILFSRPKKVQEDPDPGNKGMVQ
jgi:hypothetical protein